MLTQIPIVVREYHCNYWNATRILAPDCIHKWGETQQQGHPEEGANVSEVRKGKDEGQVKGQPEDWERTIKALNPSTQKGWEVK